MENFLQILRYFSFVITLQASREGFKFVLLLFYYFENLKHQHIGFLYLRLFFEVLVLSFLEKGCFEEFWVIFLGKNKTFGHFGRAQPGFLEVIRMVWRRSVRFIYLWTRH